MHRVLRNSDLQVSKEKNSLAQLSPLRVGAAGHLGSGVVRSPGEILIRLQSCPVPPAALLPLCCPQASLGPPWLLASHTGQVHSCLPLLTRRPPTSAHLLCLLISCPLPTPLAS